jgi:hypothetical protein
MRRHLASALAVVFVSILMTAVPAGANTRQSYVVTFPPDGQDIGFCEFPVVDEEVGTFLVSDFFDKDGNIVQTLITAFGQLTLTFSNPENGKTVVTHNETQMIRITYDEDGSPDLIYRAGVIFAFTAPGMGTVLMQVGRLVQVFGGGFEFVAGQYQLLAGDFDELCQALA